LNDLLDLLQKLETEANGGLESSAQFRALIQETEKWILSTSFQLMTQNSLSITNEEQTEAQMEAHEALLQEMNDYAHVLEELRHKGQEQIQRYPSLKESIEFQLGNLADSYDSLLRTGNQIKARLADSLAVFKAYEETLRSIMGNLDQWEPAISETIQEPIRNREDLTTKMEVGRNFHNQIQGEKSRLNLAVQNASSAAASLSRPSSPQEALHQPIPDRELAVRSRLEDNIDQVRQSCLIPKPGILNSKQKFFPHMPELHRTQFY